MKLTTQTTQKRAEDKTTDLSEKESEIYSYARQRIESSPLRSLFSSQETLASKF